MKLVRENTTVEPVVVGIRCDRCQLLITDEVDEVPAADLPARVDIDLGRYSSVLAADLCSLCVQDFLTCLADWRDVLRTVARYDARKHYRYYEYQLIFAGAETPVRVESILDEPWLR